MNEITERFKKLEPDGMITMRKPADIVFPGRQPQTLSDLPVFNRRKILTYGETKAGKTYFGGTFPGMGEGRAAIIEFDGSLNGLPRTVDLNNVDVWQFTHSEVNNVDRKERLALFSTLYELLKSFVVNPYGWKTIMLDGLTTMAAFLLDEVMWDPKIGGSAKSVTAEKDPTKTKANFDEWGALLARLQALFTVIDALPMDFYCTALVKRDKDENTGRILGMPACVGSFRQEVGRYFDAQMFFACENGKHYAYPKGTNLYPGGIRGYKGPSKIELPTYDKIFKEANFE